MWANPQNQQPIEKPKRKRVTKREQRAALARDVANQIQQLREIDAMVFRVFGTCAMSGHILDTVAILDRCFDMVNPK